MTNYIHINLLFHVSEDGSEMFDDSSVTYPLPPPLEKVMKVDLSMRIDVKVRGHN